MSDDFDWGKSNDNLAVNPVRGVAIYLNPDGDVVIRQQQADYHDEDPFLVVSVLEVPSLIHRLQQVVSEAWDERQEEDA